MKKESWLFASCIVALTTTSFGFIVRAFLIGEWGVRFNLSESQLGSLQGAGLFPFALSIIFFSLVIDRLGYGRTMAIAWVGHMASAIITITAVNYTGLYVGTLLFALANGAVEATINPATTTLFPKNKTHYLNILHAGWPGGLVLGGILAIGMSGIEADWAWRLKIGLFLLPAIIYGIMLLTVKFPTQERVAAGVSYRDMLKEFGWAGCLICCFFIAYAFDEILQVFGMGLHGGVKLIITLVPTVLFAVFYRSFGRPLFVFLLCVMVLLATTELGTDSWIAALMTPVLEKFGSNAGNWVLVYTSLIMFILRFFAGPIVHYISPLGLLAACSAIASIGLFWLSASTGAFMIFLAATVYGVGKSFFWPTTLGVVSEQFPKGGALTLNAIAGVGMIAVGVLGNPFLGALQDNELELRLYQADAAIHAKVTGPPQQKFGMTYRAIDKRIVQESSEEAKYVIEEVRKQNNQATLAKVSILPVIMCICFIAMILHFRAKGGYRPVSLEEQNKIDGEDG